MKHPELSRIQADELLTMFRCASEALEHAEKKHPYFADSFTFKLDTLRDARNQLQNRRNDNAERVLEGRMIPIYVLDCEILEAREAFMRRNLDDFNDEMAQVVAVALRMWHMGRLELQGGTAQ